MSNDTPMGELSLRTLAMPADTNPNGDIFGGWLMSQMDIAGSIYAMRHCGGRVVTVAVDSMVFHSPVHVGDIVCCYSELIKKGNTSLRIKIEVFVVKRYKNERVKVTEGQFTYVRIDKSGKPTPVDGAAEK
ncbi:acyl-CoA thioesterase [Halobacteriovorax marinus]|uniref:Acyl-coA hydrolase n=1 Tax=Halobacteriovorax marinus (strain ATCC BAA-682 / DSM 15412 / SJ) TaxID=862908 RepID=E1WZN8_HALMS|nr:acyl-CoA thioesterase [Halobacteriovorax marinus]ATH07593.1 acyl-CoA thioesterase [Halobacteriovorax marinus]CBW26224.1 putative acyl-coA hydrolase [Halobacteriovorax marinus SJ]